MKTLIVAFLLASCATPPVTPPTIPPGNGRVEETALPDDATKATLPPGTPAGDWVEALEAGSCWDIKGVKVPDAATPCPARSGIVISEERAARSILIKRGYDELRNIYQADRRVWREQRNLYETRLQLADKAIRDLQPDWLQRHALTLGAVGGFLVGVATVGLTLSLR